MVLPVITLLLLASKKEDPPIREGPCGTSCETESGEDAILFSYWLMKTKVLQSASSHVVLPVNTLLPLVSESESGAAAYITVSQCPVHQSFTPLQRVGNPCLRTRWS